MSDNVAELLEARRAAEQATMQVALATSRLEERQDQFRELIGEARELMDAPEASMADFEVFVDRLKAEMDAKAATLTETVDEINAQIAEHEGA